MPFGAAHTLYVEGVCQTCGGRRETNNEYHARVTAPTGRQVLLEAAELSEGTFGDHVGAETLWMAAAPVGTQSGTYFKTARERDGMTVWRWGGRDTVTASQADRQAHPDVTAPTAQQRTEAGGGDR